MQIIRFKNKKQFNHIISLYKEKWFIRATDKCPMDMSKWLQTMIDYFGTNPKNIYISIEKVFIFVPKIRVEGNPNKFDIVDYEDALPIIDTFNFN